MQIAEYLEYLFVFSCSAWRLLRPRVVNRSKRRRMLATLTAPHIHKQSDRQLPKSSVRKEQSEQYIIYDDIDQCKEYVNISLLLQDPFFLVRPSFPMMIHSFLSNRTKQVLLEGNTSSSINVTSGVPQGSVLGPILFPIYINDLPDYIQNNSTVKHFADDTIIYHPITNQQDSTALQEDPDALQRWGSRHPHKCQTMHITNKRNIIH